jgi:hypothetical protein
MPALNPHDLISGIPRSFLIRAAATLVLLPVLLVLRHRDDRSAPGRFGLADGLALAAAVGFAAYLGLVMALNVRHPQ